MPTFFYFYIPVMVIAIVIDSIYGFKRAKKQITAAAEVKGWKNIKVKLSWWGYLVIYQDENGIQNKTHCSVFRKKIIWHDDTDDLYLDQKTYKAKTKTWKIISITCGLIFLFLFVGYEYQQISNTIFRYSFVKNGKAFRIDHQFAIGIDSIIRGEEALKLANTLYSDLDPLEESKELAIIKLKIKNISKKTSDKINIIYISVNSGGSQSFLIQLDPVNSNEPISLATGEVVFKSFIGRVNRNKPLRDISLAIEVNGNNNSFSYPSLGLSYDKFYSIIIMVYWFFAFVMIFILLRKRWRHLLKSKKTRGYIVLPLAIILIVMATRFMSTSYGTDSIGIETINYFIHQFLFHLSMILLFTITWWNVIILASTKPEPVK
jgi:hypothetical protein